MRLIQLTDFFTKTDKEYIDADHVSRIEKHSAEYVTETTVEETTGIGPFKKTVTKTVHTNQHTRNGSKIWMKTKGQKTYVLESPEEVAVLINGGKECLSNAQNEKS